MENDIQRLIYGKDNTQRVVGIEPGQFNKCELFVQDDSGKVTTTHVSMSHWILFTERHSPKFKELSGNQPYKYIMEYDDAKKYREVLKSCRANQYDNYVCRNDKEAFMLKEGVTMYKGLKVSDVSILSFDLEHTYGIGNTLSPDGKLLIISNTFRDSKGNITKKPFFYDEYPSESKMIAAWCDWVRSVDPSIIIGHNIFGHDWKVLRHSCQLHGGSLRLGRNSRNLFFDPRESLKRKDGSQAYSYNNVLCYGREIVDTFFLALTYDISRKYDNYGLKYIVAFEKLEKKNRQHYDASKIKDNYLIPEEWAKIKAYAIDDADDSLVLFDLMIPSFFYATQSIPRTLQHVVNSATGGQINGIMVRSYLQEGHSIAKASPAVEYEGAISFGIPGMYRNAYKLDIQSLYPSIMRQYEIYNVDKDPNKYFTTMVNYFTDQRIEYKMLFQKTGERSYKDLDQTMKIFANSLYGFLGAGKLNYNYPEGASRITTHGRDILMKGILLATGRSKDEWLSGTNASVDNSSDEGDE